MAWSRIEERSFNNLDNQPSVLLCSESVRQQIDIQTVSTQTKCRTLDLNLRPRSLGQLLEHFGSPYSKTADGAHFKD